MTTRKNEKPCMNFDHGGGGVTLWFLLWNKKAPKKVKVESPRMWIINHGNLGCRILQVKDKYVAVWECWTIIPFYIQIPCDFIIIYNDSYNIQIKQSDVVCICEESA